MKTIKTIPALVCLVSALLLAAPGGAGAQPTKKPAPAKAKPKRPRRKAAQLLPPGPGKDIVFTLYTVHNGVMKMTAQMYPQTDVSKKVLLEVKQGGEWKPAGESKIVEDGWTAHFRVEKWDASKDVPFRVLYGDDSRWAGTIRQDPIDKETIVVAVFTGNSEQRGHGGDQAKADIIQNLKVQKPDLLFFSGDQVYDHRGHVRAWVRYGLEFGELVRDIPTVTIPDDHDVGQANLWGAGGKKSNTGAGHDGGYFMPVPYVQMVERAQTSHLPDPYDPTPVQRGIGVYYTSLTVGGISFAIIEDRKFKSGPHGLVPKQGPRPDHIRNPNYDPKSVDVKGAVLLGERQLKFLRHWAADWKGADMKAVLSQTVFANLAHIHGGKTNRLHADMDSNGWPQTGETRPCARSARPSR